MHKLNHLRLPRLTLTTLSVTLLSVMTVGLVICTALLGERVRILWAQHNTDFSTVRSLIKEANENLYHPAVIDPKERQQYIYEASIRFPVAENNYLNFRYSHQPADNGFKEQVALASERSLMGAYHTLGDDVFKNAGTYQQCSKEFIIQFASGLDDTQGFAQIAAKPLADGRTAYIYKNTSCTKTFRDTGLDIASQQALVTAVESY